MLFAHRAGEWLAGEYLPDADLVGIQLVENQRNPILLCFFLPTIGEWRPAEVRIPIFSLHCANQVLLIGSEAQRLGHVGITKGKWPIPLPMDLLKTI